MSGTVEMGSVSECWWLVGRSDKEGVREREREWVGEIEAAVELNVLRHRTLLTDTTPPRTQTQTE